MATKKIESLTEIKEVEVQTKDGSSIDRGNQDDWYYIPNWSDMWWHDHHQKNPIYTEQYGLSLIW